MNEEEKAINRKTWLIFGAIILLILIGIGIYYIFHQQNQMNQMEDMFAYEKELLSDEYKEHSSQIEGYAFDLKNDSLVASLTTTRAKVQRLQEELRTVKLTNARRINELKKELETLRKILRNYVIQIDSLDAENRQLKDENKQVTQKYQQTASTAARLLKEKEQLSERVEMAAKLDAVNIQLTLITAKGKPAKGIGDTKAAQLMLSFIVSKNITAVVGEQTIYVRLMKPDDDILTKPNSGRFMFENKEIAYSMKKQIEYDGEEQHVIMYWEIEEHLSPGNYRVDIFTNGNLIGRKSFMLEK
jgi:hypothetical protein